MTDPTIEYGLPILSDSEAADGLRELAKAGDAPLDVAAAALALSTYGDPEARLDPYHEHLARLASDVAEEASGTSTLTCRVEALRNVLVERWGYRGDAESYDNVENADLRRVIDRRKGLPVSLGILYMHAARGAGWEIVGLNFPGHFLLRLEMGVARAIIDPFGGCTTVTPDLLRRLVKTAEGEEAELTAQHYEPVADREVLLRLQNNLRTRLFKIGDLRRTALVTETMMLMAPNETALWREAGLLYAEMGEVEPAISALEHFMGASPNGSARHQAAALLQQLRTQRF